MGQWNDSIVGAERPLLDAKPGYWVLRPALLAGLVGILLLCVAYFAVTRPSIAREIADRTGRRDQLKKVADGLDQDIKARNQDESIILNLLAQCRTVEDIPHLGGNHVFVSRSQDRAVLYVPDGAHRIEMKATWRELSDQSETPAVQADGQPVADETLDFGEKSWTAPLRPQSGYFLDIVTSHDRVEWRLTSNDAEFEPVHGAMMEDFSRRSWSYSPIGIARFPNQLDFVFVTDLQGVRPEPAGIKVVELTLVGPHGGKSYEIKFEAELVSEGPACISASDAIRVIIQGKQHLLDDYIEGSGKYDVR